MNIHEIYTIRYALDGSIFVDMLLDDGEFTERLNYVFRASDVHSPLTSIITQWIAENNLETLPYVSPDPTQQELRERMPDKTPREFRDILIDEDILTDVSPDEVTQAIQQIPFDKERTKALNAWHNMTTAARTDPYIDMIGAMFGLSPEDIDVLWEYEA